VTGQTLSEADRQTLREQFVEVHAEAQESYDSSVRNLAAGAVAVTVSLATALKGLDNSGLAAVSLFLLSLTASVGSFVTQQLDMKKRAAIPHPVTEGLEGNRWTKWTTGLNVLAGVALISGGILLALFVSSTA
jgi:hypothetical protein